MFRTALLACCSLLPLQTPASAQNPLAAVEFVSVYWAYRDFCDTITSPLTKEEVTGLGVVAGRLGFEMSDSSMVSLAESKKLDHTFRWIDMGKFTGCTEARVFLRGIAKKGM